MRRNGFRTAAIALAALVGATLTGAASHAATLLDNGSHGYYNAGIGDLYSTVGLPLFPGPNVSTGDPTIKPALEPNLAGVTALGTWLGAAAPTGGAWSSAPQTIPGAWAVNTETAVVYELDAGPTGFSSLHLDLGVDNGIFVWLDGVYAFGALAGGGAYLWEYDVDFTGVSPGTHYLQILREDHGGGTGYQILATAEAAPAPVPEPRSMLLMGTGLLGLSWLTRRLRSA